MERVLFALVVNRAIGPASKLAAAGWASHDVAIPGLDRMDEDQAYRAMDLLVEADTDASVQEAVFFAVADLLNLEVDLLFFDTTSTYFERDTEDPDPPRASTARRFPPLRALQGPPPRSAPDRHRAGRDEGKGSRSAAGAGRGTPTTRPSSPRSATGCAAGAWAGW